MGPDGIGSGLDNVVTVVFTGAALEDDPSARIIGLITAAVDSDSTGGREARKRHGAESTRRRRQMRQEGPGRGFIGAEVRMVSQAAG